MCLTVRVSLLALVAPGTRGRTPVRPLQGQHVRLIGAKPAGLQQVLLLRTHPVLRGSAGTHQDVGESAVFDQRVASHGQVSATYEVALLLFFLFLF